VGRIVHHGKFWLPMSALGQKQTFKRLRLMSALPPSADIHSTDQDVCFVPIADIVQFELCGVQDPSLLALIRLRHTRKVEPRCDQQEQTFLDRSTPLAIFNW
jgi:hypothetical protein